MKNYERVTPQDKVQMLNVNQQEDMTRFYMYALRCFDLENQIENGELLMREETINTTVVTHLQTKIQDLEKENAELKARLEKAMEALDYACWEMTLLGICCQGCGNEDVCDGSFRVGGYALKKNECKKYWITKAEQTLAELQEGKK